MNDEKRKKRKLIFCLLKANGTKSNNGKVVGEDVEFQSRQKRQKRLKVTKQEPNLEKYGSQVSITSSEQNCSITEGKI